MLVIDRFPLSLSSPRWPGIQREGSQGLAKAQEMEEGEQEEGEDQKRQCSLRKCASQVLTCFLPQVSWVFFATLHRVEVGKEWGEVSI